MPHPYFSRVALKLRLQILGIGIILLLTYINTRGIKSGKLIQSVFTASKIIALLGLIVLGLFIKDSHLTENLNIGTKAFQNLKGEGWVPISGKAILGGIAAAMVGSVFSSVAWESVTFVSGEIENPKRNVVRAMVIGTASVIILYFCVMWFI